LCTNGTLFNQHEFACDWWYNVNCADAPSLYRLDSASSTSARKTLIVICWLL
jgi:hypothetical protein